MKKALVILAALAATSAFAQKKQINWEQLKDACRTPASQGKQVAPSNIEITCNDTQLKWVADGNTFGSLLNTRSTTAAVDSDKYLVNSSQENGNVDATPVSCPKFKQVAEIISFTQTVGCQSIIDWNGTAVGFCRALAEDARKEPGAPIRTEPTGKTTSFCGQGSGNEQRPGK